MERERTATTEPPNPHELPAPRAKPDLVWLPLTLLTVAFVGFSVAVFLRAGLSLPLQGIVGPPGLAGASTGQGATDTPSPGNLAALAPDLSDWLQTPGCTYDGTVFTARSLSTVPTICLAPANTLQAVDIHIAVRLVGGESDQLAGLVLGETDINHFYTLGLSGSGAVALDQWTTGSGTPQSQRLASGTSSSPPDAGGWMHLHLIGTDRSCFVTIQATYIPLTSDDPSAPGGCAFPGRVGVFTTLDQSAEFSQFSIAVAHE